MTQTVGEKNKAVCGFPEERVAATLLFVVPIFFCTNMLVAKATADTIPPVALAFLRWTATFALMLPFIGARLWYRRDAIRREWKDLLILGALGMGVCGAFVYIGADTTSATNIGLIYSASPVLIILLASVFFGETVTLRKIIGFGLSLCGVIVIVCKGEVDVLLSLSFNPGDLWIVAATIGWAIYSVMSRYRTSEMGMGTRFGAIVLAGMIVLAPFTIVEMASGQRVSLSWETAGWVAVLAVVASYGAFQLHSYVQSVLGAGPTSLLMYLIPVYNIGLAWALLGEVPQHYHLLGTALVLPGLLLVTVKARST